LAAAGCKKTILIRPSPEQFAVTLYKGIAFSFRKTFAVFLGLASPHANNGIATSPPETVDKLEVFFEMKIQSDPFSGKGHFHDDIPVSR
jgi:hypothetical protein